MPMFVCCGFCGVLAHACSAQQGFGDSVRIPCCDVMRSFLQLLLLLRLIYQHRNIDVIVRFARCKNASVRVR